MKIALHSGTYSGYFYEGGPLTMAHIIDKTAECGFEGAEVMAKCPTDVLAVEVPASYR